MRANIQHITEFQDYFPTGELFMVRMCIVHNEVMAVRLKKKNPTPGPGVDKFTKRENIAAYEAPFVMGRAYFLVEQ